jgi:hypothetical protein
LGIPFGVKTSLIDQWWWIMAKFEKKLQAWSHLDLPLVRKVMIVDRILVVGHIYYPPLMFPSQETYK